MLAVGLGIEAIKPFLSGLEEQVKIAAVNSPESITLSGDVEGVSIVQESLDAQGIFVRVLATNGNAYHSHHMTVLGAGYERAVHDALSEISHLIRNERSGPSQVTWHSSVMPFDEMHKGATTASYWRKNLESPVQFSEAVKQMIRDEAETIDLLLEIGPHPALSGPLKQIRASIEQKSQPVPEHLATLVRGKDALLSMLLLAGNIFLRNGPIDLTAVNAVDGVHQGKRRLLHGSLCIDWPSYAYDYGPILYYENRWNREWRLRRHLRHDILGARQPGTAGTRPAWRNMLRLKDVPWLEDHKVPLTRHHLGTN